MAKTQKPRSDPTANPRSRASKRQSSPSINVDKTLKDAPRASDATPMGMSSRTKAGVTKSKKKQKPMSRSQRARQEKVLARAEAVQDQMSKKVDGAKHKEKKRTFRKAAWDEVNGVGKDERRNAVLGTEEMDADKSAWEDIDADDVEVDHEKTAVLGMAETRPTVAVSTISTDTNELPAVAEHVADQSELIT